MSIRNFKFWATVLLTILSVSLVAAQEPAPSPECSVAVYSGSQVTQRVKILEKPEPEYDKEDRRKHASGEIVLTAVFCGSGKVTDVKLKQGLAESLNEKAIAAVRKISFIPAEKDGQKVSQLLTVQYRVRL